jgi:hypothetical protein
MCAPTPGSGRNAAANAADAVRMASHFELMDQIHRQQQQEEEDRRGQAGPHARSALPGQQRARRRRQPKQQRQHHSPRTTVTIDHIREELRLMHANMPPPRSTTHRAPR